MVDWCDGGVGSGLLGSVSRIDSDTKKGPVGPLFLTFPFADQCSTSMAAEQMQFTGRGR